MELSEVDRSNRIEDLRAENVEPAVRSAYKKLWEVGVLHRDVAPRNIIVTHLEHGGLNVTLLDFGESQSFDGPVPLGERTIDEVKLRKIFPSTCASSS